MRILVVEDAKKVASFIKRGLEEERYEVQTAANGEEGLRLALEKPFDLIVLDWLLPKKDGLSLLKDLRGMKNTTPVLINCQRLSRRYRSSARLRFRRLSHKAIRLCRVTRQSESAGAQKRKAKGSRAQVRRFAPRPGQPQGVAKRYGNRAYSQGVRGAGILHAQPEPGRDQVHDRGALLGPHLRHLHQHHRRLHKLPEEKDPPQGRQEANPHGSRGGIHLQGRGIAHPLACLAEVAAYISSTTLNEKTPDRVRSSVAYILRASAYRRGAPPSDPNLIACVERRGESGPTANGENCIMQFHLALRPLAA